MASNVQTNERSDLTASKDKGAADKGFLYKELNGSRQQERSRGDDPSMRCTDRVDDATDASGN